MYETLGAGRLSSVCSRTGPSTSSGVIRCMPLLHYNNVRVRIVLRVWYSSYAGCWRGIIVLAAYSVDHLLTVGLSFPFYCCCCSLPYTPRPWLACALRWSQYGLHELLVPFSDTRYEVWAYVWRSTATTKYKYRKAVVPVVWCCAIGSATLHRLRSKMAF